MALVSLLFSTSAVIGRRGAEGADGYLPGLELDCSVSEKHEAVAKVTELPVEDGSTVNDNVVLQPRRLMLEGIVSKTPLGVAGLLGSAAGAGAGVAGKSVAAKFGQQAGTAALAATATVGGLVTKALAGGSKSREPSDVWAFLLELWKRRTPFDVVTGLETYTNMVVSNLSTTRNKDTVGGLFFTCQLDQVTIVAPRVSLAQISVAGASPTENLGKQAGGSPSAKTAERAKTLLVRIGAPGA